MEYAKPALSIHDQVSHLISRGLEIPDRHRAERYLSNISYYRLSAYLYPYRNLPSDDYRPGTNFDLVLDHYFFDREFRLLIFDAIERVEVAFRTQLIYQPALNLGPFWFMDKRLFYDAERWRQHVQKLVEEVNRSGEIFIKHFRTKYSNEIPPAWMAFEVASLGLLSRFYANLKNSMSERAAISRALGVHEPKVFQSWVRSMTFVRNVCAHHARLWNRTLTETPMIVKTPPAIWITSTSRPDKIYYFLCCLFHMLRVVNPESSFTNRLKALFEKYPSIDENQMGFPSAWMSEPLWG